MKKNTAPRLNASNAVGSLMASVVCVLVGLAIGFVVEWKGASFLR